MWAMTKKKITGTTMAQADADDGGDADARGREHAPAVRRCTDRRWRGRRRSRRTAATAGDDIGRARRAAAQRLQDLADIGAVVIGGDARRRRRRRPGGVRSRGKDRRRRAARRGRGSRRRGARSGRTLSASWMAESASSVASLDFCGIFAIVDRRLVVTPDTSGPNRRHCGPRHERGNSREPARARHASISPAGHPIGLALRRKPRW